ncbi:MAG: 50S ribosomal protein L29 [Alkalispirochaeta sp.]
MRNSFRDLTFEELIVKREELQRKHMDSRVDRVVGHMENPLQVRTLRRQIARLNTLIYNHADVQAVEEENA